MKTLTLVAVSIALVNGAPAPVATFTKYCFQCHGKSNAMAGVNLQKLTSQSSVGDGFAHWEKVAVALEQKRMPPEKMPQPAEAERAQAVSWIRTELATYAKQHDGEPGRVTVRRLTSGEYAYSIQDLTGLQVDWGIDATSDSVGGEGFTNFGDVQFMQNANIERYLEAAKRVADRAVIGSGPLSFFADPGKTGFELSAITRIKALYGDFGVRTVSGEGGRPFGLDKYGRAFYVAWQFEHRTALGKAAKSLGDLAAEEGITTRFAQHIAKVLHRPDLGFPSSEVAARWKKLPAAGVDSKLVRKQCEELQQYLVTWPSWLFARGDVAAGGAGDESPLYFNDKSLAVEATHHFRFNTGGRRNPREAAPKGPTKIYLNVAVVNPGPNANPMVIWRNPTIAVRPAMGRPTPPPPTTTGQAGAAAAVPPVVIGAARNFPQAGPKKPLREIVNAETAKRLNFGVSPDGSPIGPDDFAAPASVSFEVPVPEGSFGIEFQVDAQVGGDRDQVYRITFSDREDGGSRGIPTRALVGDPLSAGYKKFKAGVMELATILPPNSHSEPTPADKDPVPDPFDSTFNVPEHDEFVNWVKYVRDDRFVYENMMDEATRKRLDQAWNDVYASFNYHDNYLRMLAQHFKIDLKGKKIADMDTKALAALPDAARPYVKELAAKYQQSVVAQAAAKAGHVEDCLKFANNAWRRPLTAAEKANLRAFYASMLKEEKDHQKAVRAVIARILVSPAFLYRLEQTADVSPVKPLTNHELASRMSYFLWASIPDEELRRAADAGELSNTEQLRKQTKRMLADAKVRRLSTEFFGQWLGFYHFDQHRGVDTGRFPEFTDAVKSGMYDESVSFFEHIIRKDRPVSDMLFADYTFLNQPLAKHYGVKKEVKSVDKMELVEGANEFQRGGLLRLGSVLTATSAPLRTSPVKRGDWVLRRVLGIAVPPPPADAGKLPADDKQFGELSIFEKLEQHKRNPTCANCHVRIDPLGFPLEKYDSVGRWRATYADGKPIQDSAVASDKGKIDGVDGLLRYLKANEKQVTRTLAYKLTGYALGRTVQASDELLIERMAQGGGAIAFSDLVGQIVSSRQFRFRLGKEDSPPSVAGLRRQEQ